MSDYLLLKWGTYKRINAESEAMKKMVDDIQSPCCLSRAGVCGNGCDLGKIKDKAMEYKDKIPTDKIPTKLPK